jgi:hypothetical protein
MKFINSSSYPGNRTNGCGLKNFVKKKLGTFGSSRLPWVSRFTIYISKIPNIPPPPSLVVGGGKGRDWVVRVPRATFELVRISANHPSHVVLDLQLFDNR